MSDPSTESPYTRIGGAEGLRRIIDDFVDRVFSDMMIGFFFRHADKQRVADKEYELAARFLGGPERYTGRPLREAHARHRIMGGQFLRRRRILEQVLQDHAVPAEIIEVWLEHTDRMRGQIPGDPDGVCND